MSDPYQILGISPEATDEQVKDAYREMARKYHPDKYHGNPLADLALERMQDINQAYDQIMAQRKSRASGSSGQSYGGSSARQNYSGASQYSDIRRMINARRITEAEELLDGVPASSRDAEWYFLKGSIQYMRGWLDEAYQSYSQACAMDPSNGEYRNALNNLLWQRQHARPAGGFNTMGGNTGGCSMCDICSALWCADCCCECMGGDLIRCF
ncbi:J domain-containing protein [Oscillospiraceae bacterium MB08-C2-2]|nr:J domain-containing protein [Oscillospiraceae bacterium MB08-C2-2]